MTKNQHAETVGRRVRKLRQDLDWSQETLAANLKLSIPAVSKIETGITDMSLSRISQIAALFQVTVSELLSPEDMSEVSKAREALIEHQRIRIVELQAKVIELYDRLETQVKQ